ncbi:hypothetical protein O6H91_13G012400 [Diphasiastrum complanatum]|uniref:Uncharacterized protein n=1 Tax=Diphasiastrum complanatum TaxID=34168 RepID=A0ACC2BS88_DIPCM|nr:hypothetical protein O6H91_Y528900 [Diphasiastrum complanatum]KAJ7532636.1 hypothetical protein O6H91_13G012400 [Diphasiastrum complanatum]
MSSGGWVHRNGFAPQIHASTPLLQCRKYGSKGGTAPVLQQWRVSKSLERWGARFIRLVSNRRTGIFAATLLAFVSLLMLVNDVKLVSAPLKRFTALPIRGSGWGTLHERPDIQQRHVGRLRTHLPLLLSNPSLPPWHPCGTFSLPPPPADRKRTGPRPCPVCYLPVKEALREMPVSKFVAPYILKDLSYVHQQDAMEGFGLVGGTDFGGHQTMEEREKSFQIRESMHIHCGFARGLRPGVGSGFDFDEIDHIDMDNCYGVVVASAIFGKPVRVMLFSSF